MGAAAVVRLVLLYQPGVGFVNQSRRLQRVAGTLVAQVAPRELLQLGVKQWDETIERVFVPCRGLMQQRRNGLIFRQFALFYRTFTLEAPILVITAITL